MEAEDAVLGTLSGPPEHGARDFPRLPFELLRHLLYFLDDSPWTLYCCIQVSRVWAIAGTRRLWQRPLLNNTSSARAVLSVLSQCRAGPESNLAFEYNTFVSALDLRWSGLMAIVGSASGTLGTAIEACGPELRELLLGVNSGWILRGIPSLGRSCPKLRMLDLGSFDCGPREIDENVKEKEGGHQGLRGCTLMDVDINKNYAVDFFRRFDNLSTIGFSDTWAARIFEQRMSEEEVDTIAAAMADATSLRLRLGGPVTRLREDSALLLHTIARTTSRLQELQLDDTMTTNDLALLTFLKNNPGLRSLTVSSAILTRVAFEGIGKLASGLEQLVFNMRLRWNVDALASLLPQLKRLHHLQLNAVGTVVGNQVAVHRLSALLASTPRRLTVLEIYEATPDWRNFLAPILVRHGSMLDILTVNPHVPLAIADVRWILDRCPLLKRLTVVGQSMAGEGMELANGELTRTDLHGFVFVFGGREIRNVKERKFDDV